jgi:phenylalanyl-tRNA synthetase beta subunit
MTTDPITEEQLRDQVARALSPYGIAVDVFLATDHDDLENNELRDLWLMVKGALAPAS